MNSCPDWKRMTPANVGKCFLTDYAAAGRLNNGTRRNCGASSISCSDLIHQCSEYLEEERRQMMMLRQEQRDRWNARVRAREAEPRQARAEERAARRLTDDIADVKRAADATLLEEAIRTGESRWPTRPRTEAVPRDSSNGESKNQLEEPATRRGSRRGPATVEELQKQHHRRLARRREWRRRVSEGTRPPLLLASCSEEYRES
uniref:Uncharacterized protein n=1 Tax=Anopheles farauti TaxID=69004 RepID=A0A182QKS3_9DIPT